MAPRTGSRRAGAGRVAARAASPPMAQVSQIVFSNPDGMNVNWDVSVAGAFDSEPLIVPGRYNFTQAAIYRLKLSNIPNRPGVEVYPTLESGQPPCAPRLI